MDLILLDLMLPSLNSLDVCRELAQRRDVRRPSSCSLPKPKRQDQIVGFSLGADDYVTKPFSVKVLLERIKACGAGWNSAWNPETSSSTPEFDSTGSATA